MSSRKKFIVTSWAPFLYERYPPKASVHYTAGVTQTFFGQVFCLWEGDHLVRIALTRGSGQPYATRNWPAPCQPGSLRAEKVVGQILSATFTDAVILQGTTFELTVWQQTHTIPRGATWSYKKLAQAIDKPKACRAVGSALGRNPLSLLIPCHRVIAKNGDLGNFHWGVDLKRALLSREKKRRN